MMILYGIAGFTLYGFGVLDNYELIFFGIIGVIDILEKIGREIKQKKEKEKICYQ